MFPENIIQSFSEIACIIGEGERFKQWSSNVESSPGYTTQQIARITAFRPTMIL